MRKTISYGIDQNTGYVISRVGSEIVIPVLAYDEMGPEDDFALKYRLEKFPVYASIHMDMKWTRKIPVGTKNVHRTFWDMKPLKEDLVNVHVP